ncbi:MAG: flippase-like domain-containing protein [Magnetococcales bacterium]|nr:flippase-like domain-containing protein [Magnetococcales bacterium]
MRADWRVQWLWRVAKGAVAAGMVWLLLQQGVLDLGLLWAGSLSLPIVVVGLLCNVTMISLGAVRWFILLGSQGMRLPFAWVHGMTYLTVCFNLLVPGSIGGDALRMGYLLRQGGEERQGAAIFTILLDRSIGLYTLFCIALVAALANAPVLLAGLPSRILLLSLAVAVLGAPLFVLLLLWGADRWSSRLAQQGWQRILAQMGEAARRVRQVKGRLLVAVLVSALAQGIEIIGLWWIARQMGLASSAIDPFFLAAPVAWVANLLPIAPGGLGVGEAAFAQVCQWLQPVDAGVALGTPFLINRLLQIVASLPGLWVYLAARHQEPPAPPLCTDPRIPPMHVTRP